MPVPKYRQMFAGGGGGGEGWGIKKQCCNFIAQGVKKRCRLSWLTNSALVYRMSPNAGGGGVTGPSQ